MQSEGMIALSAAAAAIAAAGVLSALRGPGATRARLFLIATYVLCSGVASIPLVIAFAPGLYGFYLPAVLPMLFALPLSIHHYVAARTAEAAPPPVRWGEGVLPAAGLIVTFGYWMLPSASKAAMFMAGELPAGIAPAVLASATFALIVVWSLSSLVYLIATLRRLGAFRSRLKDVYSNTDNRELRWIDWFMALLVALWFSAAVSLLGDNFGPGLMLPGEVIFALAAILLLVVAGFAPVAPPVAPPVSNEPIGAPVGGPAEKYARSALSESHAKKLAQRIESAMREDALYLDPNLSLQTLSRHVGALPNLVSQTLNEEIGSTFFDYVARWRIEAAKPRIQSGEASVLEVALEVGFNSRSTFYKAFKRETGMTPKAFREASGFSGDCPQH